MPARSAKFGYSYEEQRRFEDQLRFIQEHKMNFPKLTRSVAEETGFTAPNVYSVFNGNTFNATIIRAGYSQLCRIMGMLSPETSSEKGNEDDEQALRLLSEAHNIRANLAKYLIEYRDLRIKISRKTKDLRIIEGNLDLLVAISLEDMSDGMAVQVRDYLASVADLQEPPSTAIDIDHIPKEVIDMIAMLKASGDITEEGYLAEETRPVLAGEGFTPDGPEVDPLAPGRHVDAEGNEYFLGKD